MYSLPFTFFTLALTNDRSCPLFTVISGRESNEAEEQVKVRVSGGKDKDEV